MVGMRTRVIRVDTLRPEIMVIARGFQNSAPCPLESAMGTMPKMVVRVVIMMGLRR